MLIYLFYKFLDKIKKSIIIFKFFRVYFELLEYFKWVMLGSYIVNFIFIDLGIFLVVN